MLCNKTSHRNEKAAHRNEEQRPLAATREKPGNVYMYYKLYGFYQNLYRYILSRSNSQLVEILPKTLIPVSFLIQDVRNCAPFKTSHNGIPIAPCGAIANSMFNGFLFLDFPVNRFRGEKAVVLSTLTWSGGSSLFLGLAYVVTGAVTWLAFFSMLAVHLRLKERKMFFLQQ
ncbi:hypothetical protein J1605_000300 [Eschrichtius robustus]|uniref:Cell cycle control protein 50C n=1 Tax=Eschrichtius robustus TaxID=9764 RepID=A0AB34HR02_ESCRO|nr:hypothetical protein J1605_000300 [Eschrichtius robustus]